MLLVCARSAETYVGAFVRQGHPAPAGKPSGDGDGDGTAGRRRIGRKSEGNYKIVLIFGDDQRMNGR